ncbi:MAG TPA: phenylacetate--CoA ligase family protein [Candidatus Eisenbacteria bacterium]|nr:phenylacetate--CoA ligase family protein [Candidatus Eisenbacteria bacterium]
MGSDAYGALVAGVLFPLHEILKGHSTNRRLRELERSQWWDVKTLESDQLERLRAFLADAGSSVPYYRDLFARVGFDPASVRNLRDLARLPILTKAEIRTHRAALVRDGATGLAPNSTGGSTGEPLQFLVGPDRVTADVAHRRRAMRWWNVDIGDPEIVLWGSPIEITRQDRVRMIRDRLFRSTLLSAAGMTPARLDEYLDTWARVRPAQIFSHASALCEVATHAERTGRDLTRLGTRVIFVTSEELYGYQREQLERVFGCKVANGYGGRDAGFVAQECPKGGMHLSVEDVVVEIVDSKGLPLPPGEAGEIVVTHLATGDFPFIRYGTSDIGVLDAAPCACGRGLPLLRELHGRADDLLQAMDGARIPGQMVVHLVKNRPEITGFKLIQEAPDLIRVQLVVEGELVEEAKTSIVQGVRARLGQGMRVEFEKVPSIPREASGKYRSVVSRIGLSPAMAAERTAARP